MTIDYDATEFATAAEAVQWAEAAGQCDPDQLILNAAPASARQRPLPTQGDHFMATKKASKNSNSTTTNKKKAGTKRQVAKTGRDTAQKGAPADAAKSKQAKPERPKRVSGLDLAAEALAKAGTPLNAKNIAERVIAAGWKTSGLTPAATLYSAIQREIAKKGSASRFKKVDRGQFVINEARATK